MCCCDNYACKLNNYEKKDKYKSFPLNSFNREFSALRNVLQISFCTGRY